MQRSDGNEIDGRGLNVALIHADIQWKEKEKNISKLLALNEEAAKAGAKIILNTEMAITGYSFESREDIRPLTETVPGPATDAFGEISKEYSCYICIGLPEKDPCTDIYYNAAAVVGPDGKVAGKYRKIFPAFKENLWAARGNLPVPAIESEFGKFGVIICADSYSYKPARVAVLKGSGLLLILANWPPENNNPEKFWRARSLENGIYIIACNRTGKDKTMNCQKAESFIINPAGAVVEKISSPEDKIICSTLPIQNDIQVKSAANDIIRQRRPRLYGNISLDTYSHLNTQMLLCLPENANFTVAALQMRSASFDVEGNLGKMLELIDKAIKKANFNGSALNLVVFPELATTGPLSNLQDALMLSEEVPGRTTEMLSERAREKNIFIVFGMAERKGEQLYNSSVLVGPEGVVGEYRKVHLTSRDKKWACEGNCGFPAFNLPFCRVGMQIGFDLLFPEGSDSLSKIGTDLLCVPAFWEDERTRFIWDARLAEQMHLVVANQWGETCGSNAPGRSLLCSYSRYPEKRKRSEYPAEEDWIEVMSLETKWSREKRFLENVEYDVLLNNESDS